MKSERLHCYWMYSSFLHPCVLYMLRITWVVKPVLQWFWTGWGVVWFRSYQDKSIRGLQIVSWAVEAKRRVCMASSDRSLMKLFVCALIVWAAVLLSVPQRLYQSPGPHTPWGCVAAINAASQTEHFVVSSISTYIGVGSNSIYCKSWDWKSLKFNSLLKLLTKMSGRNQCNQCYQCNFVAIHEGLNKLAGILWITFNKCILLNEKFVFWFKFNWSLFLIDNKSGNFRSIFVN